MSKYDFILKQLREEKQKDLIKYKDDDRAIEFINYIYDKSTSIVHESEQWDSPQQGEF